MNIFREEAGITLIETVITLFLIVFLITAFTAALVTGVQTQAQSANRKQAINLAADLVELLHSKNVQGKNLLSKIIEGENLSHDSAHFNLTNQLLDKYKADFSLIGADQQVQLKYTTNTFDDGQNLLTVTIQVKWQDRHSYQESLKTLLAVDLS